MIVVENRASVILFNFIRSNCTREKIVLIPANVCFSLPLVLLSAGQKFEVVDIDDNSLCIKEDIVLEKLKFDKDSYCGLLFVRTYGIAGNFSRFFKQIKEINNNFKIIDDKCLSIPEIEVIEPEADLTLFSTGKEKYIDLGWGGFGVLAENTYYDNYIEKRSYDQSFSDNYMMYSKKFEEVLRNRTRFELSDLDWLYSSSHTINVDGYFSRIAEEKTKVESHKKSINRIYTDLLPDDIQFACEFQDWRFNIVVPNQERIIRQLFNDGLFASTHYKSISTVFGSPSTPITDFLSSRIINLFNNKKVTLSIAELTVNVIKKLI